MNKINRLYKSGEFAFPYTQLLVYSLSTYNQYHTKPHTPFGSHFNRGPSLWILKYNEIPNTPILQGITMIMSDLNWSPLRFTYFHREVNNTYFECLFSILLFLFLGILYFFNESQSQSFAEFGKPSTVQGLSIIMLIKLGGVN